jgi:hypothetical protein
MLIGGVPPGLSVIFTERTAPAAEQLAIALQEASIVKHRLAGNKIQGDNILKLAVLPDVQ